MHILIPLALVLLIQGFLWGFIDSGVLVEILGNDYYLVAYVTLFYQHPMQSMKLDVVFLEHIIIPPRKSSLLIHR